MLLPYTYHSLIVYHTLFAVVKDVICVLKGDTEGHMYTNRMNFQFTAQLLIYSGFVHVRCLVFYIGAYEWYI